MRNTILTIVALAVVSSTATAQWTRVNGYTSMDHGHSAGNVWNPRNIESMPNFGVVQIFPGFPQFNGTVIDDFFSQGVVTDVGVMFEASMAPFNVNNIKGWRVSIWDSPGSAGLGGTNLDQNTIATTFVPNSQVVYAPQFGTGSASQVFSAEMGVNLTTGVRQVWIGMAAELDFTTNGQVFIMRHTQQFSPVHVLGAGTANDAWGVNPGGGFGGNLFPLQENAVYGVNSVPEPATLVALGLGLAGLARRRRRAA